MKPISSLRACLLATAIAATPATASQQSLQPGFGWFAQLAGFCWEGLHPGEQTRDRQCYATQFDHYLRGTILITAGPGGTANHRGDSVFAWDDRVGRLTFYFWGSDGRHGASEGYYDGTDLIFPAAPTSAGQSSGRRTVWRRIDADSYQVTVQREDGNGWNNSFRVTYHRSPASP